VKTVLLTLLLSATGQKVGTPVEYDVSARKVTATGSTTARSLAARAADVVNVKDYGAKGDGTTDDRAAIALADAAAAAAHVPLVFPGGVFRYVANGATYTALAPAWIGAGQGNTYDSNNEGGTIIKIEGANGGLPVIKPPPEFAGFHFDGVDSTATGVALGQDGSFVGFRHWRNITLRRFNRAIEAFNFYSVTWDNIVVQGNHEGIRIAPTDGAGDDGYFTATAWRNVHIADNDVYGLYVSTPQGTKTWTWENVVIERNGANGTYQAFLQTVSLDGKGVYFEGSPTKYALQASNVTLSFSNGYMNGTGGINATSNAFKLFLSRFLMGSATDVFAGLSALSYITARDGSFLQADPRLTIGGRAVVEFSDAGGAFHVRPDGGNRTTPTYGASVAIDAKLGREYVIDATDGVAFTIANPTNAAQGLRVTIRVRNTSGGALGTITWGTAYKLAAWTSPATGYSRAIDFQYSGSAWIEVSRTPADVPN
jgi:hypothetical protein